MRQLMILAGAIFAIGQSGLAVTICSSGSVADYVALGSGGCTIGSDTFSNFGPRSNSAMTTAIPLSTIQVTPSGGTTNPTLTFNFNVNASAGQTFEAIFSYRLLGNNLTGSMITLSNTNSLGNGEVTDVQNICAGGMFGADGVSGCTGTVQGPLVNIGNGSDMAIFGGAAFLSITDDLVVDSGGSGSASGGRFVDRFTAASTSAVPEPGTILFTALGTAALVTLNRFARKDTL